ncbi:MAG TPA: hypothetical protein VIS94_17345 [Desulfomonilia bacterium]
MRKLDFIFVSLFILLSAACSADGPDITSVSLSDRYPVTEQKIVLGVSCLTNNPPMTYTWNCDSSDSYFQDGNGNIITPGTVTSLYGLYWVAPRTPGTYTVTCTIGDKLDDKTETACFIINVSARGIIQLMNANPATAESISYDVNTMSGGIFAVVSGDKNSDGTVSNNVKMFTSVMFKIDMGWGGTYPLEAIYPIYYSIFYATSYVIWGGYMNGDSLSLVDHSSSADDIVYTKTTSPTDSVNSLTLINDNIWISADSGLWKFDTITTGFTNQIPYESYNADNSGSLSAVATSMGVYYCTTNAMNWEHLPSDSGEKTLSVVAKSSPLNIFALLDNGKLMQYYKPDGITWSSSDITPTGIDISSVSKISKDPKGRIWVGKYRYNPSPAAGEDQWFNPDTQGVFPAGLVFDYTIVSAEGLVYFRTADGQLWVWGKTPDPFYPE